MSKNTQILFAWGGPLGGKWFPIGKPTNYRDAHAEKKKYASLVGATGKLFSVRKVKVTVEWNPEL